MTMPAMFASENYINVIATIMFRRLRSRHGVPCLDVICGTAYLVSESDTEIIDFTMLDLYVYPESGVSDAMVNLNQDTFNWTKFHGKYLKHNTIITY